MDIVIGLLWILVGLGLAVAGLRVFLLMLPIAGFFTGFMLGAILIANWLGDGFLATAAGWIVGIIVGLVFAYLSYAYWYIGALMAAGASGALLASGLFHAFGVDNGTALALIGVAGAVLFVFVAFAVALPVYIVLVNTAIMGAYMVIGGLMLLFNRVDLDQFGWGTAVAAVDDHWMWWIVLIVVAGLGIFAQMAQIAAVTFPVRRWERAQM